MWGSTPDTSALSTVYEYFDFAWHGQKWVFCSHMSGAEENAFTRLINSKIYLCWGPSVRELRLLSRDVPGTSGIWPEWLPEFPLESSSGRSIQEETPMQNQNMLEILHPSAGLETPQFVPGGADGINCGELSPELKLLPHYAAADMHGNYDHY